MKKSLFIFLMIWGQSFFYAQTTSIDSLMDNNRISWGTKVGLNTYNFYGKETDYIFASSNTQFRPGFHAGIFVNTKIGNHWGLTHELIFNLRRVGVTYRDSNNNTYHSTVNSSYIDIVPAHLNYQLPESRFNFFAGPYVSVLVAANTQRKDENGKLYRDRSIFGDADNDESKSYYLQKFDFGMHLGIEYQLKDRWSVGLRYTHGFTDLYQNSNSSANGNIKRDKIKIYNRGFLLSLAYNFIK